MRGWRSASQRRGSQVRRNVENRPHDAAERESMSRLNMEASERVLKAAIAKYPKAAVERIYSQVATEARTENPTPSKNQLLIRVQARLAAMHGK